MLIVRNNIGKRTNLIATLLWPELKRSLLLMPVVIVTAIVMLTTRDRARDLRDDA